MQYEFQSNTDRARFIAEMPSSLYMGTNEHGEQTFIFLEQNAGMVVKVIHEDRPNTFECIEYNAAGQRLCVYYETDEKDSPKYPSHKYPQTKRRASDRQR